jgi:hypothetical protein
MKKKELNVRIFRSAQSAVRARIHLDCFIFLTSQENLNKFEDVLDPYWDFFRFDRLAHEWAFYIRISNLLKLRGDTDNLPGLLNEMDQDQAIRLELLAHARSVLTDIDPVMKAVGKIRNKVVAHQDDTLSQPQVYAKAQLTLPGLTKLSDASLEVANCLCVARDLPTQQFLTGPIDRLRTMLEALLQSSPMCWP